MQQAALNLPNPLAARQSLFTDHGKALTTSYAVAERFGKVHRNVTRDIEKLIVELADSEFSLLNFEQSTYTNARGKVYPAYRLTHDGFALLVMGFTGRDALAWKVSFLKAFNSLEAELLAQVAREAAALHQLRPLLAPIVADTLQGLSRAAIGVQVHRSAASITYHRRTARRLGLLSL